MWGAFFKPTARAERLLRKFLLLAATLVACLAVLEILTRVVVPSQVDVPHLRVYPQGFYTWYPRSLFTYHNLDKVEPPSAEIRINADGLRDEEVPLPKDRDETRILVLGDSFTAAVQLPEEQVYSSVLEERLSHTARDGRYRVINAGFNGAGTAHELLYFLFKGRALEPDIVILQIAFNDLDDNTAHDGFSLADGELVISDDVLNPAWWKAPLLRARDAVGNSSLVFYLTYRSVKNVLRAFSGGGSRPVAMSGPRVAFAAEADETTEQSHDEESALLLSELVGRLVDEANAEGIPVIIMTLPYPLFLGAEDERFALAKRYIRRRTAETHSWLLEMRQEFLNAHRLGEEVFLPYDGHLGVAGHRIVAGALERALLPYAQPRVGPTRPSSSVPKKQRLAAVQPGG